MSSNRSDIEDPGGLSDEEDPAEYRQGEGGEEEERPSEGPPLDPTAPRPGHEVRTASTPTVSELPAVHCTETE
jgi:hypothetical protein